jgi:predicted GIY-YIG superfamily endonuclease
MNDLANETVPDEGACWSAWGNEASLEPHAFLCADRAADRYCCYILGSRSGMSRYVGMTCDPARRIRQHNGEIKGGARATRAGGPWTFAAIVAGFADHHEALTAEWRIKRCGRGRGRGPEGALAGLADLLLGAVDGGDDLGSRRWTSSSRFDLRESGLSLFVRAELLKAVPVLESAASRAGWTVTACGEDSGIDPAEVVASAPSAFRPLTPAAPPVDKASRGKAAGKGTTAPKRRRGRRLSWWT